MYLFHGDYESLHQQDSKWGAMWWGGLSGQGWGGGGVEGEFLLMKDTPTKTQWTKASGNGVGKAERAETVLHQSSESVEEWNGAGDMLVITAWEHRVGTTSSMVNTPSKLQANINLR